jgi:hypothetical protein
MDRVAAIIILLAKNLSVSIHNVLGVLLKQVENSDIEVFMPLNEVSIVENLVRQVAMINVHILKTILVLFLKELIEKSFLEVDSFDIEHHNHAVVVSLITNVVIKVSSLCVHINLLVNHVCGSTHFRNQVQSNVFVTKITKQNEKRY